MIILMDNLETYWVQFLVLVKTAITDKFRMTKIELFCISQNALF